MNIKTPKLNFTKKNIIGFIVVFVFIASGTLLYKNFIAKGANYAC